ncbi:MAG: endopeptidase La [Chitinophagales bacterium]
MDFEDFLHPIQEENNDFIPIIADDELDDKAKIDLPEEIPVLALRNSVIFPGVIMPITVGRDTSLKAIKAANKGEKLIAVFTQTDPKTEDAGFDDLYEFGTVARIMKVLKMPDGSSTVILQGAKRIQFLEAVSEEPFLKAKVELSIETKPKITKEFKAIISTIKDLSKEVIEKSKNIPSEASMVLKNIKNRFFLINFTATNLNIKVQEKQQLLNLDLLELRANKVLEFLQNEIQMLDLKNKIQRNTRIEIEKQQKDYFLNQQLKNIQDELGQESPSKDYENLMARAKKMKWSKKVKEHFEKEAKKLQRINPAVPDYSVTLNHLELMLDLPWNITSKDNLDLKKSKTILDKEHYGLDKIKDRILEYLAVLKLKGDMKSPILCFIGPPGVGKTSLGKSIATAMNRKYVRMSLGGLHDESELRGHRKTYIGAMPGRILQSLKKVKTSNPVFILDEIDKLGNGFRGDPSSALLEILDPEQNSTFYDNYLETEFDLSKVMFIATANAYNTIQPALRDRMEIIDLSGYSIEEKVEISQKHLIPNQLELHGLKKSQLKFTKTVLEKLIDGYTRESGVRNIERVIASVIRSVAKRITMDEPFNTSITFEEITEFIGKPRFERDRYLKNNPAGVAVGLAYTTVGGDILFIESSKSAGKPSLKLTGSLGDVMKESATIALSLVKANAEKFGISLKEIDNAQVHVHVPEGATPKDGPSAGITLLTTLVSLFTGRKVKPFLAMTGEITLRGKVLPVGGIKEKVLAAKRAGIKEIIMCKMNQKDVEEINQDYVKGVKFHFVDKMEEVIELALVK